MSPIHRLNLAIAIAASLACTAFPNSSIAQPAAFPTEWEYWMSDPDENGSSNDYRDVQAVYYQVDQDYIYLRLQNLCDCGWGPNAHGRYKWFIETNGGDAALQGGTFRDYEFLLMLEDHMDNTEDPLLHDHNKAEHDFLGELYLLDDLDNTGVDVRWGGGSQPHPYMANTPTGSPSPSPYFQRELGAGVGGFGGSQSVLGTHVGFMMEGQFVDMYVSRAILDNPSEVCMYWATDQENQNLDQAPHQDRPSTDLCFDLPTTGTITISKHIEPDGSDTASFPFTGDLGAFSLNVVSGADASTTFNNVPAGSYDVAENLGALPSGYRLGAIICDDPSQDSTVDITSGNAAIQLSAGEEVHCTFTNVAEPALNTGTIIIVKHSVPHDPQSFDFTSNVAGFANFSLSDDGDQHTLTMQNIAVGSYTVSEVTPLPAGWHLDGLLCVDPDGGSLPSVLTETAAATIDLDANEVVTCTFTNGQDARVTIEKQTNPDGGTDPFGFTGDFGSFSLADDGTQVFDALDPNDQAVYVVSEATLPPGHLLQEITCSDPTGGTTTDLSTASASIRIDHGDDITCTFRNAETGTLVIHKETNPPVLMPFAFTDGFIDFDVATNSPYTFTDLAPSVIAVTELPTGAGTTLTSITCIDPDASSSTDLGSATAFADVDAGETVECTFTNEVRELPIPLMPRWMLLLMALALATLAWGGHRSRTLQA